MSIIPYLNFFSRLILFIVAVYKAVRTREKGWTILSIAFLVSVMDIENYILKPLGISINPTVYPIVSKIPNFYIGILTLGAAFMLKYGNIKPKHILIVGTTLMVSYVWIFAMAIGIFKGNFTLRSIVPSFILGGSTLYLAIVLWEYVVEKRSLQILFPLGLAGVGLLNLTYPFTREINWFYPLAFFGAAIFRLMAAIGALKMIIFSPKVPEKRSIQALKPGAYWTEDEARALEIARKMNTVMITRRYPVKNNGNALVYWITKVKEGEIKENVYAISPTKIDILTDLIARAFRLGYNLLYIDAVEFLILENGFKATAKFLYTVKDIAIGNNGSVILVLNPKVLQENQLKIIEREFQKL
ncbi:hypothetical protein A3L04_02280 [Thermococcus chitonophagus]|uniref:DUF835 domain-containing protein n=1 Tax=Thermococcus chitonophagus TaxID=54262 RepID=A0A160VR57_9EURY|nr:DUF835 domain-containing protein [Thermococcus chitonophagus]ASJ15985.1 hypothetical protein A3L04_02280 [Thermococcus chitonophagus]CUX77230.1 hypothetical protein CHITON_0451 [Thermococcus chitonophagus]